MMKNIILLILLLLISCMANKEIVEKQPIISLDVLECENQKLGALEDFCGVGLKEIETWSVIEKHTEAVEEESRGLCPEHPYEFVVYQHPKDPITIYAVMYVLVGEQKRAERIGVFMIVPGGFMPVAIFDRYKNTDLWYQFNAEEFDKQHNRYSTFLNDFLVSV